MKQYQIKIMRHLAQEGNYEIPSRIATDIPGTEDYRATELVLVGYFDASVCLDCADYSNDFDDSNY